jgi:hypothetical protein
MIFHCHRSKGFKPDMFALAVWRRCDGLWRGRGADLAILRSHFEVESLVKRLWSCEYRYATAEIGGEDGTRVR